MSDEPSTPVGKPLLPYLTAAIHASSPFIATFLLIHLTAPVMGLGGSQLASQTMVVGREYYQAGLNEKYLVLLPIAVHGIAGLAKRLLSFPTQPRPGRSPLPITGYATLFFFLPIHYLTHRVGPANPTPPISSVGPSELDFEYVKYALTEYPWRSWLLYVGLTTLVTIHAVDGIRILWNTYYAETFGRLKAKSRRRMRMKAISSVVVPVATGLALMASEPRLLLSSTALRFDAALKSVWVYRV